MGCTDHTSRRTLGGVIKLLEMVQDWPDVFFVTNAQLIEYMKNPVPVSQVGVRHPGGCVSYALRACVRAHTPHLLCHVVVPQDLLKCDKPEDTDPCTTVEQCYVDTHWFSTCGTCPPEFPTVNNYKCATAGGAAAALSRGRSTPSLAHARRSFALQGVAVRPHAGHVQARRMHLRRRRR